MAKKKTSFLEEATEQLSKRIFTRLCKDGFIPAAISDDSLMAIDVETSIYHEMQGWIRGESVSD